MDYMEQTQGWYDILPGWIWGCNNILPEDSVTEILALMYSDATEKAIVDGNKEKHLVGNTNYNYIVNRDNIRSSKFVDVVLDAIDPLYLKVKGVKAPRENLNPLQFFSKFFIPNESFYEMHVEDPHFFGDMVFVLYLSDEKDGDLVLPSKEESLKYVTPGYKVMDEKFDIQYVPETIRVSPKKNFCVMMKVGISHLVEPCTGDRPCVTGWSFADGAYLKEFKK